MISRAPHASPAGTLPALPLLNAGGSDMSVYGLAGKKRGAEPSAPQSGNRSRLVPLPWPDLLTMRERLRKPPHHVLSFFRIESG